MRLCYGTGQATLTDVLKHRDQAVRLSYLRSAQTVPEERFSLVVAIESGLAGFLSGAFTLPHPLKRLALSQTAPRFLRAAQADFESVKELTHQSRVRTALADSMAEPVL